MTYPQKFLLVMLVVAVADVCWTLYFIETEKRRALAAGFWSASIMVASAFITTSYVHDRKLVPAAVLGAFIGTAGVIRWKKHQEAK